MVRRPRNHVARSRLNPEKHTAIRRRGFSVKKHGRGGARELAVVARRKGVRAYERALAARIQAGVLARRA